MRPLFVLPPYMSNLLRGTRLSSFCHSIHIFKELFRSLGISLPHQATKLIPPVYFPFISGLGIGLLSPEGVYLTGLARGALTFSIPAFPPFNAISVI